MRNDQRCRTACSTDAVTLASAAPLPLGEIGGFSSLDGNVLQMNFKRGLASVRAATRRRAVPTTLGVIVAVVLSATAAGGAIAALGSTLVIGLASELRSIDPHRSTTAADDATLAHAFESLIRFDPAAGPTPVLARAWTQQDENTWHFTLRPGVRFHDGSLMSAEDVAFSIQRALKLRPELAIGGTPEWLTVEVVDKATLRLHSRAAHTLLMQALSGIRIVSAASVRRSESGGAAKPLLLGTGPYRLAQQTADGVTLVAAEHYWGKAAAWKSVTLRALPNGSERVAALRAGALDVVERVPPEELEPLRDGGRFAVHPTPSGRLMYLQLGNHAVNPPDLSYGAAPSPAPNPLLDPRVRRAISEALDRRELATIGVRGLGEPAVQLVPPGFFGHVPGLPPELAAGWWRSP